MQSHLRVRGALAVSVIACVASFVLTGCAGRVTASAPAGGGSAAQIASSTGAAPTASQEATLYTPTYRPNGAEVAVIKTNKGVIKVKLYGLDAPVNTANFIELSRKGFYD